MLPASRIAVEEQTLGRELHRNCALRAASATMCWQQGRAPLHTAQQHQHAERQQDSVGKGDGSTQAHLRYSCLNGRLHEKANRVRRRACVVASGQGSAGLSGQLVGRRGGQRAAGSGRPGSAAPTAGREQMQPAAAGAWHLLTHSLPAQQNPTPRLWKPCAAALDNPPPRPPPAHKSTTSREMARCGGR